MPSQTRTFKGVPVGKKKIDGVTIPAREVNPAEYIWCDECKSERMEDLSFVRQRGYFQDVCISVVQCVDCGSVQCLMWAEEYE